MHVFVTHVITCADKKNVNLSSWIQVSGSLLRSRSFQFLKNNCAVLDWRIAIVHFQPC